MKTLQDMIDVKSYWVATYLPTLKLLHGVVDAKYIATAAYAPGKFSEKNMLTKVNTGETKIDINSEDFDKVVLDECDLWLNEKVVVTMPSNQVIEVNVNRDSAKAMFRDVDKNLDTGF